MTTKEFNKDYAVGKRTSRFQTKKLSGVASQNRLRFG